MALRANQASEALIQYEAGQELVAMAAMTTTDSQTFFTSDNPWSGAAGYEPDIRPNGIRTGGVITPTASTNDSVDVSAATVYLAGEAVTVTADTLTHAADALTRPGAGEFVIHSVIITAAGVYDVEPGEPTTAQTGFTTTRGAVGGPPWIPTGAIEVGHVRMTGAAAQVVAADIRQVAGTSTERYDVPLYSEDYATGSIEFISALPAIHSDNAGVATASKKVFAEIYTPTFASLEPASDFVPPETTHSQSSTAVYGGAIGASSSSLGQGSFTVFMRDGVTDPIIGLKNQKLWVKFYPHRLRAPHILAQGILGVGRSFPAGDAIQAACTLTADGPAVEMAE